MSNEFKIGAWAYYIDGMGVMRWGKVIGAMSGGMIQLHRLDGSSGAYLPRELTAGDGTPAMEECLRQAELVGQNRAIREAGER